MQYRSVFMCSRYEAFIAWVIYWCSGTKSWWRAVAMLLLCLSCLQCGADGLAGWVLCSTHRKAKNRGGEEASGGDAGCRRGKCSGGQKLMVWQWVNVHWVETENGMWEVVRKACISLLGLASLPPWHQLLWTVLQRAWPCSGPEPGPACMPAAGPCGSHSGTTLR